MPPTWKQFLICRLPIALLVLGAIAEGTAALLQGTPQLRHPLDHLVRAMQQAEVINSDVVVLGDSVTQDAANQYSLAPPARLSDLTTNQASGMTGSYFLLRRHIRKNGSPRHVVIAATPEFFGYTPNPATAEIYLSSVFTTAEEQRDLASLDLLPDTQPWTPAILEIESRIFNRLTNLVFQKSSSTNREKPVPSGNAALEGAGGNATPMVAIKSRFDKQLTPSETSRRALQDMCKLIAPHDAVLHLVIAPTPTSAYQYWKTEGRLSAFEAAIRAATADNCPQVTVSDFNETRAFPDHAFRDSDHLRRPGWTSLYAHMLKQFIAGLN